MQKQQQQQRAVNHNNQQQQKFIYQYSLNQPEKQYTLPIHYNSNKLCRLRPEHHKYSLTTQQERNNMHHTLGKKHFNPNILSLSPPPPPQHKNSTQGGGGGQSPPPQQQQQQNFVYRITSNDGGGKFVRLGDDRNRIYTGDVAITQQYQPTTRNSNGPNNNGTKAAPPTPPPTLPPAITVATPSLDNRTLSNTMTSEIQPSTQITSVDNNDPGNLASTWGRQSALEQRSIDMRRDSIPTARIDDLASQIDQLDIERGNVIPSDTTRHSVAISNQEVQRIPRSPGNPLSPLVLNRVSRYSDSVYTRELERHNYLNTIENRPDIQQAFSNVILPFIASHNGIVHGSRALMHLLDEQDWRSIIAPNTIPSYRVYVSSNNNNQSNRNVNSVGGLETAQSHAMNLANALSNQGFENIEMKRQNPTSVQVWLNGIHVASFTPLNEYVFSRLKFNVEGGVRYIAHQWMRIDLYRALANMNHSDPREWPRIYRTLQLLNRQYPLTNNEQCEVAFFQGADNDTMRGMYAPIIDIVRQYNYALMGGTALSFYIRDNNDTDRSNNNTTTTCPPVGIMIKGIPTISVLVDNGREAVERFSTVLRDTYGIENTVGQIILSSQQSARPVYVIYRTYRGPSVSVLSDENDQVNLVSRIPSLPSTSVKTSSPQNQHNNTSSYSNFSVPLVVVMDVGPDMCWSIQEMCDGVHVATLPTLLTFYLSLLMEKEIAGERTSHYMGVEDTFPLDTENLLCIIQMLVDKSAAQNPYQAVPQDGKYSILGSTCINHNGLYPVADNQFTRVANTSLDELQQQQYGSNQSNSITGKPTRVESILQNDDVLMSGIHSTQLAGGPTIFERFTDQNEDDTTRQSQPQQQNVMRLNSNSKQWTIHSDTKQ